MIAETENYQANNPPRRIEAFGALGEDSEKPVRTNGSVAEKSRPIAVFELCQDAKGVRTSGPYVPRLWPLI